MKDKIAQQRTKHLSDLSGLKVFGKYIEFKGEYIFCFCIDDGTTTKTLGAYYTYKKAKAFAEGIKMGKELNDSIYTRIL